MSNIKEVFSKRLNKNKEDTKIETIAGVSSKMVSLLKEKNYTELTELLLTEMPEKQRIEYICGIFSNGAYRSFISGMKRFTEVIEEYKKSNNRSILVLYNKSLQENPSIFNFIASTIIGEIIDNKNMMFSLNKIIGIASIPVNKQEYKKHALELMNILYPENQALKVLFI